MKEEPLTRNVGIAVDMINPLGVESAGSPDQAMDFVSLGEQKFSKIGSILAGDTGNQCAFQLGTSMFIWFLGGRPGVLQSNIFSGAKRDEAKTVFKMFNCFGLLKSGCLVYLVCLVHLVDLVHATQARNAGKARNDLVENVEFVGIV